MTLEVCTILAIVVGPVIAVCITRKLDRDRAAAGRKMEIFRALMRTRGIPIHWDHVGALNLVEVEFIDHQDVIETWKKFGSVERTPSTSSRAPCVL